MTTYDDGSTTYDSGSIEYDGAGAGTIVVDAGHITFTGSTVFVTAPAVVIVVTTPGRITFWGRTILVTGEIPPTEPLDVRDIDDTETEVQAIDADVNALAHLQEVAASEGGVFFIASDGTATFFERFHSVILEDDDLWGDADGEKHYATVTTSYDDSQLWNEIVVTADDLTDQVAEDETSQSLYGGPALAPRTLTVSTVLASETDMLDRAETLVAKYSTPEFRITSMNIDNGSGQNENWPRILLHDIHARVLVRRRPVGDMIEQPSFIEGITWDIGPSDWETGWALSSTLPQVGQWELGTVGLSELGVTTSLVNVIA